jgi:periplasmic divalent cation tolerance protein
MYNPNHPVLQKASSVKSGRKIHKGLWFVNKKTQYGVNMGPYSLCLVTINDLKKAREIAGFLVQEGLAACVNIIPEIRSIYKWNGEVCDEIEGMLVIKTRSELFEKLQQTVKELHPYEVPEIISVNIESGFPPYLQWIHDSTAPDS